MSLLVFYLFSSWYATVLTQHLWYNEKNTKGDILINEVSIQSTAVNTYYETLGWNQGGLAGGYTGIQHTKNGNVFIYSLWDPSLTVQVTSVVYSEPNSVTERFGGEGTGYHFLTRPALGGTSWKLDTWYTLLTRCWDHGTHTYYGLWVFDSVNWRYLVTIDYPYSGSRFNYGAMSFLENYAGTGLSSLRRMSTRNGWKRYSNGQWSAFTKGTFDKNSVGGVSGNNFFMSTQSGLPNTITTNTVQQVPSPSTTTPVYPALSVTSLSAVYDLSTQKVTISWVVDTTRSPQFSYSVNIYLEASTTSALTSADSAPQIRSVELNMQGLAMGTYKVSLIVVDVLDVASSEKVTSFSRSPAQSVSSTRISSAVATISNALAPTQTAKTIAASFDNDVVTIPLITTTVNANAPLPKFTQLISNDSLRNVIQLNVYSATILKKTSNLVDIHNGYNMDNIVISGKSSTGTWTLTNKTPRKFSSINAILRGSPVQLVFTNGGIIDEFSNNEISIAGLSGYQVGDSVAFVDPHPLFRVGASSFSNNNRTVPPSAGVIVGLNEAEVRLYHRIEINIKMVYAEAKTRPFFINFIRNPNLCVPSSCSESDHSLSDALSKWYRTTSHTLDAQLVAFINSDATGLAAGAWYGMHRCVFNAGLGNFTIGCGYGKLSGYNTFSHENAHEQGYSHSSGMAYGWDPYLEQLVSDLIDAGKISADSVPFEQSNYLIARQRGNTFYVAATNAGAVKVAAVTVIYGTENVAISSVSWDATNTYFTINVDAGGDTVVIEAIVSGGIAVYMIAFVEGFYPINSVPSALQALKPGLRYINNEVHIYPPMTYIGSRKVQYATFLDGKYQMSGTTNDGCYYCYRNGFTDMWTGSNPGRSSVFTVTVTDETSASFTFAYSAADAISGFNNNVLRPVYVKTRGNRLIIRAPVEAIGPRNISFMVLLDGKYFLKDNSESTGQICYDCYFYGPQTDIQHLGSSAAALVVQNITQYPYVVSNALPSTFSSLSVVSVLFVDRLSRRMLTSNYTVRSLLQEQANAPTFSPIYNPTTRPTTRPSISPTTPTQKPSAGPSTPTTLPSLQPSPRPTTGQPTAIPTAPSAAPTGCWVKHTNAPSGSAVVISTCGSCRTLELCQQACLKVAQCISITFTYPYYSNCELNSNVMFTSGWSNTYDLCAYSPTKSPVPSPTIKLTNAPTVKSPTPVPSGTPSTKPTRRPSAVPVSTYNPTTSKPTSKPTTNKPGTRQPTAKVTTVKPTTIQPSLSSGFPTSSSAAALSIVGPLSFDGVKSYYGYGSFKPSLGSAFTLSMWITQAATSSTDQYLACLGRTPKNYVGEFILQVLSNNVVKYWEYGSNGYGISVTSSSIIALGKRTHVALVRNGLQGTLYLNSVVDISGTSTLASAVTFMNANFTLGKNIREGSSYFKGSMDRVEVYSNALTQTQITSLYNSYK